MTASSSFPCARSRWLAAVASVLTVITVAAVVVALVVGASLRESWWPRTGAAFVAETSSPRQDPCEVIVGPAKKYCERGTTTSGLASGEQHDVADAAFRLVPIGAGLTALVIWRRRRSLARGRG